MFSAAGKEGSKGELRASGPLEKGKPILAFGGGPNMPMTITFQVRQIPAGRDREADLRADRASQGPDGQRNRRLPRRDDREWPDEGDLAQPFREQPRSAAVAVRDVRRRGLRGRSYDVDRRPLGFELKLDDFDMGFEPGTEQPTHFVSQVRLTDPSLEIKDQPHTISMNNPLDHRGFTFYQSNYIRVRDPHTGGFTGQFQSVFQVATNPGRPIIYAGCCCRGLGAFLQFYMRAGIFTDGGKKERERALAKKQAKIKPRPQEQQASEDL